MKLKVSIVIPCYEEAENIPELCYRLNSTAKNSNLGFDIILVDDYSGEGTEKTKEAVKKLHNGGLKNINLIVRLPSEGKGLCSAVIHGISFAKHDFLVVMDADLQHEPETVPFLVKPLLNHEADFVYGSRHVIGGTANEFTVFRQLVSKGATVMASGLTSQSDPMSGFFALNKKTYNKAQKNNLSPLGYKIGLELLVRSKIPAHRVKDVPIKFQKRIAGSSKLTPKQYLYYILHLLRLYWFLYARLIIFATALFWIALFFYIV